PRQTARGQAIPDGRKRRELGCVAQAVGLAGVLVHAVRERRTEERAEVAIERGPLRHGAAEEGEVVLAVVADREDVVGAQPPVARAVVLLDARALVRMVGILVAAALIVRRERLGGVPRPRRVEVSASGLAPVGLRPPSQEMV